MREEQWRSQTGAGQWRSQTGAGGGQSRKIRAVGKGEPITGC